MVVAIANKGTPADGIVIDGFVEGSTDGTTTVSPAVENLTTLFGGDGTSSFEAVRSTIFNICRPDITVRHCGSCARGDPRIPTLFEGDFDSHVGSIRILVRGTGPVDVLVPVHLARSGPSRLVRVVSDSTVTEDEILIAELLGLGSFEEADDTDKAGRELEDGHYQADRQDK